MKRHTGQRALYEAWSGSQRKQKRPGLLDRLKPQLEKLRKPSADVPPSRPAPGPGRPNPVSSAPPAIKPSKSREVASVAKAPPAPARTEPVQPWLKSRAVQVNAGRIEISISYQVGIAVGLALILLLLVAFKIGQMGRQPQQVAVDAGDQISSSAPQATPASTAPEPNPPAVATRPEPNPASTAPTAHGDHWIVLAYNSREADLVAAQLFFARYDIPTAVFAVSKVREAFRQGGLNPDVLPSGDGFLLTTDPKEGLFDNPQKEGTDGYAMRQRIREIGAQYSPAAGLGSFDFSDVYGMKVTK